MDLAQFLVNTDCVYFHKSLSILTSHFRIFYEEVALDYFDHLDRHHQ